MSWGIGFKERGAPSDLRAPTRKRFRPVLAGCAVLGFALLCLLAKCAKVYAADYHITAPGARIEVVSGQGGLFGFQFSNEFAIESDGFSYAARQGIYGFNLQSFDPQVAPTDALSHVLTSQLNPVLRLNNHWYMNATAPDGMPAYGEADNDIRIYTAFLDDDGIIHIEIGGTLEHWTNIEAFGLVSPVPFQATFLIHRDTPDLLPEDSQRYVGIGEHMEFSFGPSVPELNAGILIALGCIVCAGLSRRKP